MRKIEISTWCIGVLFRVLIYAAVTEALLYQLVNISLRCVLFCLSRTAEHFVVVTVVVPAKCDVIYIVGGVKTVCSLYTHGIQYRIKSKNQLACANCIEIILRRLLDSSTSSRT